MTTQTHISFNSPLWSVGLTDTQRRTVVRWVYDNNRQDCVGLRIYPDKVETEHVRYHEKTPEEEFTRPVIENSELSLEARPTDTEKPFPDLPWDTIATRIDAWAQETFPAEMWPRHYYPEGPDGAVEHSYPSEAPR